MYTISLKAARINADMLQTDVSTKMGVTNQTICNWETGQTRVSEPNMRLLAIIYGIPREMLRRPNEPR